MKIWGGCNRRERKRKRKQKRNRRGGSKLKKKRRRKLKKKRQMNNLLILSFWHLIRKNQWCTRLSKILIKLQRFNYFSEGQETVGLFRSFMLKLIIKVRQLPLLKHGKARSLVALPRSHGIHQAMPKQTKMPSSSQWIWLWRTLRILAYRARLSIVTRILVLILGVAKFFVCPQMQIQIQVKVFMSMTLIRTFQKLLMESACTLMVMQISRSARSKSTKSSLTE
jgi:hypothetical protein